MKFFLFCIWKLDILLCKFFFQFFYWREAIHFRPKSELTEVISTFEYIKIYLSMVSAAVRLSLLPLLPPLLPPPSSSFILPLNPNVRVGGFRSGLLLIEFERRCCWKMSEGNSCRQNDQIMEKEEKNESLVKFYAKGNSHPFDFPVSSPTI